MNKDRERLVEIALLYAELITIIERLKLLLPGNPNDMDFFKDLMDAQGRKQDKRVAGKKRGPKLGEDV